MSTTYYDNGNKCVEKEGDTAEFYDLKGRKTHSLTYKDGKLHGIQRYFYDTGVLKMELEYNCGVLSGNVRIFYPSGSIKREIECVQGKRSGAERLFAEDGTLIYDLEYRSGAFLGSKLEDPIAKAYNL